MSPDDEQRLRTENEELRNEVRELRETLEAISAGEVDAIVVSLGKEQKIYTLENADHPYQALFENIREGALVLSPDGVILYANSSFAAMARQPLSRIIGASFVTLFVPGDRPQITDLIRQAARLAVKGNFSIGGETAALPVLISANPVELASSPKISIVVADRSLDVEALRQSEARYRTVADNTSDWEFWVDPQGHFVYCSPSCEKITGHSPEEFLADPGLPARFVHPDDRKSFARHISQVEAKRESGEAEWRIGRPDGTWRWMSHACQPVFDEHGTYLGVRGANRDITDRKELEQALEQRNEQLSIQSEELQVQNEELATSDEEIRNQNQELLATKEALEERTRALDDYARNLKLSNEDLEKFAYIASHDLQEPLRMVTLFSQLLEKNYKGRLDPDADEFIQYIVDGGKRMGNLVNDLLDYSRVTSRAKPFEPTDMNIILREVLGNLSVAIGESGARIEAGPLPTTMADSFQMTMLVQNLISNAIKFRKGPGPSITIGAIRRDDDWIFSVQDDGIGINADHQEKIFEIFQRLHTTSEYSGTGIGLAICRRIVERHGGRIWVESEEGKGSTFFFSIPVEARPYLGP